MLMPTMFIPDSPAVLRIQERFNQNRKARQEAIRISFGEICFLIRALFSDAQIARMLGVRRERFRQLFWKYFHPFGLPNTNKRVEMLKEMMKARPVLNPQLEKNGLTEFAEKMARKARRRGFRVGRILGKPNKKGATKFLKDAISINGHPCLIQAPINKRTRCRVTIPVEKLTKFKAIFFPLGNSKSSRDVLIVLTYEMKKRFSTSKPRIWFYIVPTGKGPRGRRSRAMDVSTYLNAWQHLDS